MNKIPVTSENKCTFCKGSVCCTYITQEIDAPRSMHDYDHLLWQISHNKVSIFKDHEGWFLLAELSCDNLLPGGGCGVYETRPSVCREHSNDWCEYDESRETSYERHYKTFQELDDYCRQRYKNWDKRHSN